MEKSIQSAVVFQTYSVLLNLLNKSLLLLAEKGADQQTLDFLVKTINTLMELVNEYSEEITLEKEHNDELNEICSRYRIARAPKKSDMNSDSTTPEGKD